MQIYISKSAIIANIQRTFRAAYPYLRLEFYWPSQAVDHAAPAMKKVPPKAMVKDVRMKDTFGWIDISPNRTAPELEYDFKYIFGLHAHVLPRSGDQWLKNACTDTWSLALLNAGTICTNHCLY